jgi:hypothetical protein
MLKPAMERLETVPQPNLMTDEEAKAVLQLWAERQSDADVAKPSIQDLAEALRVPESDVAGLLAEVRAKVSTSSQIVTRPKQFPRVRVMVIAAVTVLAVALTMLMAKPVADVSLPTPVATEVPQPVDNVAPMPVQSNDEIKLQELRVQIAKLTAQRDNLAASLSRRDEQSPESRAITESEFDRLNREITVLERAFKPLRSDLNARSGVTNNN